MKQSVRVHGDLHRVKLSTNTAGVTITRAELERATKEINAPEPFQPGDIVEDIFGARYLVPSRDIVIACLGHAQDPDKTVAFSCRTGQRYSLSTTDIDLVYRAGKRV